MSNIKKPAHILQETYGFRLPITMQDEFNLLANSSSLSEESSTDKLHDLFFQKFINNTNPYEIITINFEKEFINTENERLHCKTLLKVEGNERKIEGIGNGTLNALANALYDAYGVELGIIDYFQHGLTQGSNALAASYLLINDKMGHHYWGVGIDTDSTLSAIRALLSALNRSLHAIER